MCTAIYAAVVLVAFIAALTVLRVREPSSPNAELLAEALNSLGAPEAGAGAGTPCQKPGKSSRSCINSSPALLRP